MRRTKEQKAITLIALILTIVVLLILAVVAISAIQNDGILSYAQNAAKDYNQAAINEQDTLQGYLNFLENGGSGDATDSDLEFLKRYVLGAEGTGRVYTEILDMNTMLFLDDEATTELDESTTVTFLTLVVDVNGVVELFIYAKYENKEYRIVVDGTTGIAQGVELVYIPEGREGTTVAYDSNLDGETEEWVIITDRGGKVEIVSKDVMKDAEGNVLELSLGSIDTSVNVTTDLDGNGSVGDDYDKAILSYNNAITTINNYCDELVIATNNEGVRSIGGTNNTAPAYHSTNYDNWGASIKVDVASGDTYDEEDFMKLSYFGISGATTNYWIASRSVCEVPAVTFGVKYGVYSGMGASAYLLSVESSRMDTQEKLSERSSSSSYKPRGNLKFNENIILQK